MKNGKLFCHSLLLSLRDRRLDGRNPALQRKNPFTFEPHDRNVSAGIPGSRCEDRVRCFQGALGTVGVDPGKSQLRGAAWLAHGIEDLSIDRESEALQRIRGGMLEQPLRL